MNLFNNESGNPVYDGAGRLNHSIWHYKAFRNLLPEEKLAFIYLIAGPEFSPSGIFTVSPVSVAGAIWRNYLTANAVLPLKALESAGLIDFDFEHFVCWVYGIREFYVKSGIVGMGDRIDADVQKIAQCDLLNRYKVYYELTEGGYSKPSEMLNVLMDILNLDPTLKYGNRLELAASDLAKNYEPDQVRELYGRGGWWYRNDWRGKKGQYPTVETINLTIKQAVEGYEEKPKDDWVAVADTLSVAIRRGMSRREAENYVTSRHGIETTRRVIPKMRWADWCNLKSDDIKWRVRDALNEQGQTTTP